MFLAAKAGRSMCCSLSQMQYQQEPAPREDVGAIRVNSQFQVGPYLVADFDGMYFIDEMVRQEAGGAVWVKNIPTVGGKLNRYNSSAIEDVDDTPVEEIFLPRIPASQATGGRNRVQYVLQEGLRQNIVTAHHNFL